MTEKQKRKQAIKLIQQADGLLGEALRLRIRTNGQFSRAIVDAQLLLDDAITYTDSRQTLLEKSA